ncbi:antibiotic biosynthesis monooxygenase [Adhaeribacter swui]|uniref:Antibiotic biosynthesis monooxygenase n=1 Tax=Adhaeribacter swui TaxID=2086471 RepID=A0A7G7G782_9BACT|nr:antibiotic biosynthesis monooxygenase family protein [Adhaeribacter swui]QNF33016.1 antibiotic biosynthesis monooxygenase [Adhaeribacter swui]
MTAITKDCSVEIIRYAIPPEQQTIFEQAYTEAGILLQNAPYCLGYELIKGVDEPQNYLLTIYWTSLHDHLNGFRKSASFGQFFNLVRPFYAHIQEMKHYEPTNLVWQKPS